MTLLFSTAYADRDRRDGKYKNDRHQKKATQLRLDKRYSHNRSYPREGHTVRVIPKRHRPIHYHDRDYFYISGVWHLSSGSSFVVVRPLLGIVIPAIAGELTSLGMTQRNHLKIYL